MPKKAQANRGPDFDHFGQAPTKKIHALAKIFPKNYGCSYIGPGIVFQNPALTFFFFLTNGGKGEAPKKYLGVVFFFFFFFVEA